jgi:hypothetical protein
MNHFRWNELSARERTFAKLLVVKRMKRFAAGRQLGIGPTRSGQLTEAIYRVAGVSDLVQLAFEMGRHWKQIRR